MHIWYTRIVGTLLFALGLWGMFGGRVPYFFQLDLFQSFVYIIFGAIGLQLGLSHTTGNNLKRYVRATGILGLTMFLLGITFPNFFDIFHLEVPEHVFHLVLGVTGSLVADKK